jgi:D-alanine-D-alanine ligase
MKVGVIHGGVSPEYDVSIASGQGIIAALHRMGHEPVPLLIDPTGEWHAPVGSGRVQALTTLLACDVVVPALHGAGGEDGTVQGLLEMLGVPYVGSGVGASALCLDKDLTKTVVARAGVRVAPGVTLDARRVRAAVDDDRYRSTVLLDLAHAGVHLPLFVKPVHGGSSIGVSRVSDANQLRHALGAAGEDSVLVESEVTGLEVDVPVLELADGSLRCGPSLLVNSDPGEPFFTETAKYTSAATRFTIPAPLPDQTARSLEQLALTAFRSLGCRGLARVDFFVTADGPVLNEVNTFPGFTPQSQFPRMWATAGLDYEALVKTLLLTALERRTSTCRRSSPTP